jgi:hypothetical protein
MDYEESSALCSRKKWLEMLNRNGPFIDYSTLAGNRRSATGTSQRAKYSNVQPYSQFNPVAFLVYILIGKLSTTMTPFFHIFHHAKREYHGTPRTAHSSSALFLALCKPDHPSVFAVHCSSRFVAAFTGLHCCRREHSRILN